MISQEHLEDFLEASLEGGENENPLREIDDALARDAETTPPDELKVPPPDRAGALGRLLRVIGSVVLVAAATAFLVQRWGTMNSILRYVSFLGFTSALTGAAYLCGIRIKEDKGARTFLSLAAAMVTVNFAQLGALLYSTVAQRLPRGIPELLVWQAPSLQSALLTLAGALIVLVPITVIAMRVLVRGHERLMTIGYLAINALLLVPNREPWVVGTLMIVGVLAACEIERRVASSTRARTQEGYMVRGLMFAPVAILIGRSVLIYHATQTLTGLSLMSLGYLSFTRVKTFFPEMRRVVEISGYSFAGIGWCLVSMALADTYVFPHYVVVPLVLLPISGALALGSLFVEGDDDVERIAASILLTLSAVLELSASAGVFGSFYAITVGAIAAVAGYSNEQRAFFLAGLGCLGLGLFKQLDYAVRLYTMSPWVSLAILGIGIVVASSYVERHYGELVERIRRFKKEIKAWR